jgi:hypothetical protein
VNLLTNSIRSGSLFDQPTSGGGTRTPKVHADEITHAVNEARERAMHHERDALLKYRPSPIGRRHR